MLSLLRSLLSSCLFCCEYSVASWEKDRIRWVLKFPSVRVRDILKAVSYPWIMGWVSSWNHYKPHSSWLQAEAGNPGFNNFLSQCWLWPHWWLGCPACLCKPGDVCLQSTGSQVGSLKLLMVCGLDLIVRLHWHTLLSSTRIDSGRQWGQCPSRRTQPRVSADSLLCCETPQSLWGLQADTGRKKCALLLFVLPVGESRGENKPAHTHLLASTVLFFCTGSLLFLRQCFGPFFLTSSQFDNCFIKRFQGSGETPRVVASPGPGCSWDLCFA